MKPSAKPDSTNREIFDRVEAGTASRQSRTTASPHRQVQDRMQE